MSVLDNLKKSEQASLDYRDILSSVLFPQELCDSRDHVRFEDMSPDGSLHVHIQEDGDVIVTVRQDSKRLRSPFGSCVEFTTPGSGGGQSPRVRNALLMLALAIKLDNEERPQHRESQP